MLRDCKYSSNPWHLPMSLPLQVGQVWNEILAEKFDINPDPPPNLNSWSAVPTHEVTLATLMDLRLSSEPLKTNLQRKLKQRPFLYLIFLTGHSGILSWILLPLAPHIMSRISLRFLSLQKNISMSEKKFSIETLRWSPSVCRLCPQCQDPPQECW